MSWDDFRYFLHVARTGNLSAAARALDVAQPTVGRRIEALQERIGSLFDRRSQGLTLSPLGEEILPFVESIARQAEAIDQCVKRRRNDASPTLRIATTLGLATHWLTPKISALRARHPDIAVSVHVGIALSDLALRDADVHLRMGAPGDERLIGRRIGTVACGLYASASYLAARGTPQTLEELFQHSIIESEGEITNLQQARALRQLANPAAVVFATNNATIQLAALEAGLGIGTMPCFMADASSGVRRILAADFHVGIDLWLLANPAIKDLPTVRVVLEHLGDEARRDAEVFAGHPR